jgi:beta-glucosidase
MSIGRSTAKYKWLIVISMALVVLIGCGSAPRAASPDAVTTSSGEVPRYKDPSQPAEARVQDLLARMTTAEKIGQMMCASFGSIDPAGVRRLSIGSVLSGGDGNGDDSPESWHTLIR